ncbi:TPA: hypothetical protein HA239_04065 [Candidatus Woesearchaeota archaeon]|nr:hypothetical protein QT06_C0001G0770 [archaeon GW2011_AR15]MBS3103450.1 hypothetical protein [Candidatus Woesearchaeota archaeon]HIH41568.1 hypothetical protein [Candidatus Woesearchaeota archaeon]
MRKAEITFTTLVYAALAVLVILVLIAVFFALTNPAVGSIFGIITETGESSQGARDDIAISLGSCEPGTSRCVAGIEYVCGSNKRWGKTENEC